MAAAAEFYGKVFGWTFETYGGDDDRDTYTLALADGLPIGGLVQRLTNTVAWLQQGRISVYLSYSFITLVVLLAVML